MGEGDLKLNFGNESLIYSLKMIKEGSYINTKSAGALSIFKNIFLELNILMIHKIFLVQKVHFHYKELINKLSLRYGIRQDENFETEWLKRGFSNEAWSG